MRFIKYFILILFLKGCIEPHYPNNNYKIGLVDLSLTLSGYSSYSCNVELTIKNNNLEKRTIKVIAEGIDKMENKVLAKVYFNETIQGGDNKTYVKTFPGSCIKYDEVNLKSLN